MEANLDCSCFGQPETFLGQYDLARPRAYRMAAIVTNPVAHREVAGRIACFTEGQHSPLSPRTTNPIPSPACSQTSFPTR